MNQANNIIVFNICIIDFRLVRGLFLCFFFFTSVVKLVTKKMTKNTKTKSYSKIKGNNEFRRSKNSFDYIEIQTENKLNSVNTKIKNPFKFNPNILSLLPL